MADDLLVTDEALTDPLVLKRLLSDIIERLSNTVLEVADPIVIKQIIQIVTEVSEDGNSNGNGLDDEIAVWTSDGTLEGDTNFKWDGSTLTINGSITEIGSEFELFVGGVLALRVTNDQNVHPIHFRAPTSNNSQLNDITHAVNTGAYKAQGSTVHNLNLGYDVYAQGSTDGAVWVNGIGTIVNTPV